MKKRRLTKEGEEILIRVKKRLADGFFNRLVIENEVIVRHPVREDLRRWYFEGYKITLKLLGKI